MKIESYSFGKLVVDGKQFTSDVIISPHAVRENWWRRQGHSLCEEDLKDVLGDRPEVLIIGTGQSGFLQVPETLIQSLSASGISVVVKRTAEACREFNRACATRRTVAALHLTC